MKFTTISPDADGIVSDSTLLKVQEDWIGVEQARQGISYPPEGNALYNEVEETSFWFAHRNDVLRMLVRRFSPGDVFFDIGGGNGSVAMALQAAGIDVVLVEPGPAGAANAKARGVRTVIRATLEDAGFRRGSLPAAGVFDVVEHIADDAAFLRTISECLRPGGYLYLTVPAHGILWSAEDVHAGHFRRYTARSLRAVLAAAEFEIIYCSYFFSFLTLPILLLRTLPYLLNHRRPASPEMIRRQHKEAGGVAEAILQTLRKTELRRIQELRQIPFGSSCVAVARKVA